MKFKRSLSLVLVYSILCGSLVRFSAAQNVETEENRKGLEFSLRQGEGSATSSDLPKNAAAEKLSAAETNAILRRLPPMEVSSEDETDFSMRPASLPPPRTGKTISVKFPADESQPAPKIENAAPLEILRAVPNNAVPLVADLSVTVSQPMIAVSSQTASSETVPVKLSPEIKGKWRWLGTTTLIFDAEHRFPMATRFVATIPAGTKSAVGGALEKDFSWSFETPAPKVESFAPTGEAVRRDAVFLATFNQNINPADVLTKISATADSRQIPLRLAEKSEIEADRELAEKIKTLVPDQWMAFRAVELLPQDSSIQVVFDKDLPSAEGVLQSAAAQNFTFRTYGDLKFLKSACGYNRSQNECSSSDEWRIEFSNALDAESFDKSLVRIEPKMESAEITIDGSDINISGCCREPRKNYKVEISGALKDEFGQTLGEKVKTEFKTGAETSDLFSSANEDFLTLDPFGKRLFSVHSRNYPSLKVKLYAVTPENYAEFYQFTQYSTKQPPAIGKLVYDKKLKIKGKRDYYAETKIDLNPALKNGVGHAILVVETPLEPGDENYEKIVVWLQATAIGVDAFADDENLTVYASDLKDGKPLKNVSLKLKTGESGITGENGLAVLESPKTAGASWLVAQNGADSAILFGNHYYSSERSWAPKRERESLRWFVFDDRQMYRPGETVSVKGYVRRMTTGKLADIEALGDTARSLGYVLRDAVGREIASGKADLNAFGAFDFQINLPETINLGYQNLEFSVKSPLENTSFTHRFQVQEFRRPEFEVTAKNETAAPFFVKNSATVSVEAKYYAGGELAGAETNWLVKSAPADYAPPNRDEYTFGRYVPWWRDAESDGEDTTTQSFKGKTDANGKNFLAIDLTKANSPRPYLVTAEARVADVNRQTFAASTSLLVHPSEVYVGLRTEKSFYAKDEKFRVETIATDIDGKAIENAPVAIVAELKDWEQIKGEWQEVTVDTQTCQLKSTNAPLSCEFDAKQGGEFTITASVLDKIERRNESEIEVWVAGGKIEPSREVEREAVELIPAKEKYAPGDVAEILVNAPFYPAEGVLTVRRGGIVETERFSLTESSTVLKIPVEERFVPNFYVQIDLFGAAQRVVFDDETDAKLPKRPAYAGGELNFQVSTDSRTLKVAAEPLDKTLEPGGATTINVAVADNDGNPAANTEVVVVAVDESILALTNYRIPQPVDIFYKNIESGALDYYSRGNIVLSEPEDLLRVNELNFDLSSVGRGAGYGYGSGMGNGNGDGDGGGVGNGNVPYMARAATMGSRQDRMSDDPNPIRLRTNFNALAIFAPSVRTDASGRATVKINLPDNLTRYRITAVAGDGAKKFGLAESTLTARQSLMIRPSAPRFMNFGDRAELPVVVQNQTDKSLTADVAMRAANAQLTDGDGRRITIPANDRVEIRFPVTTAKTGVARFQIGAVSGDLADAAEFSFPVLTPATTEAFATYGTTDESGAIIQPVTAPNDIFPQFGGLEVTTSSTQLQELTDAFIYLQSYPFECSEQVSSRILSVAALRDVLQAFKASEMPSKEQIEAKMETDIERLKKLQHADGGFSFWSTRDESIPYLTVHVAHALARAKSKGYYVPSEMTAKLNEYLRTIETRIPKSYSDESARAIAAYALYVRDLAGDKDAAKARRLLQEAGLENLSAESLGWLLSVLAGDSESSSQVAAIKQNLFNRVTETAGAANFMTKYRDGEYVLLSSDRRTDGVVLESLLKIAPESDLIPKLVRGLLSGRTRGRWRSTQENAFVLLALDKYFHAYEKVTPDFAARVWFGKTFAGEQKFAGRSTESQSISIPMNYLAQTEAAQNLILDKQGAGRIYYRIGLKYAPKNLKTDAADYGFKISRSYEAIDAADDVRQNADGSWAIRSGARVRVRLQMIAPSVRYHVALVDNLPAGFEILNANLAVTESLPDDAKAPKVRDYYGANWFDHENLRDNRAEIFKIRLFAGVWDYSYVARATTPGSFVAPSAKAEEMYAPETFGRSKADFVRIE